MRYNKSCWVEIFGADFYCLNDLCERSVFGQNRLCDFDQQQLLAFAFL